MSLAPLELVRGHVCSHSPYAHFLISVIGMILKEHPDEFALTSSHTSRKPREGEINGVHYWFVTMEEFETGIKNNMFIGT